MRHFLTLSLTCCVCAAQSISLGVMGGGRLTADVASPTMSESRFYAVGPMIEFGLPAGFGIEFDALYHREGYLCSCGGPGLFYSGRGNSWEFPLLLRYQLPVSKVRPFVQAGAAVRYVSGTVTDTAYLIQNLYLYTPYSYSRSGAWAGGGFVVGGGFRFELGRMRVSPEIRYTHWGSPIVYEPNFYPSDNQPLQSSQNQVDLLVDLSWILNRR
jgi:hypothetical protein